MNKILSPAERRALKARAHPLKPTVMIGNDGLSASVLQEIDSTLKAHELIKIRVDVEDSDEREDMLGLICASTGSSSIDHIGKILVIYREKPHGDRGKGGPPNGRTQQQPRKAARNGSGGGGGNPQQPGPNGEKRKAKSGGPVWTKVRQQRGGRKGRSGAAKRGPGGGGGGGGGGEQGGGA